MLDNIHQWYYVFMYNPNMFKIFERIFKDSFLLYKREFMEHNSLDKIQTILLQSKRERERQREREWEREREREREREKEKEWERERDTDR